MTITSARVILPSRTTANISDRTVPPLPPVYSVRDPSSQGTRVQNTDYEASRADPGSCAIVIDNGTSLYFSLQSTTNDDRLARRKGRPLHLPRANPPPPPYRGKVSRSQE